MNQLVSIIVPVYNVKNYLSTCIDSILNQTYTSIELILVDDGSIDGSDKICDEYAKKDSRVTVVHKKNEGVSVARNTGIQVAKGKYIQFVDSDDFLRADMTDCLMREVNIDNVMPICNMEIHYRNKRYCRDLIRVDKKDSYSIEQYLLKFLTKYKTSPFIGSPCNKIFIKDIIIKNNIKFQEGRIFAEDFIFNLEYLYYIKAVAIINKSLYYYRVETLNSLSKDTKSPEYWWNNYKQLYVIYQDIFNYYGLLKDNNVKIKLFIEFSARQCIRRCFKDRCKLNFYEKVQKLKYICEDKLTQESMPIFEYKDMKIIRFLSQRKAYNLLGFLLVIHSYLIDRYISIQKIIYELLEGRYSEEQ